MRLEAKPPLLSLLIPAVSLLLSLGVVALLILAVGVNPLTAYKEVFAGAFGSLYGLSETLVKATPLILAGLGVSLAFRMLLWNIGAEGQLYMGAFAATWVALTFPEAPAIFLIPAMTLAGLAGGALWGLISALLKAEMAVNEIISTLMLNYVAILWVEYLIYGPWKDPQGYNFPLTASFPQASYLPRFFGSRVHLGLIFGLTAAVILYIILKKTRFGFEIKVMGESLQTARYAGMNVWRNIILVMAISGALAGLAGMSEVAGIQHRLQRGLSPGYGYTAIIVAVLAKKDPWGVVLTSILLGGLITGSDMIQISLGLPVGMAYIIQGAILFFFLAGEYLARRVKTWSLSYPS